MVTYLNRIQILRFIAAAMVLVGHAQLQMQGLPGIDLSNYRPFGSPALYASGVDIFFVLSGFIMYAISRTEFGQPGASIDFFKRRLARIAPPYWVFTTAMICASLLLPERVTHTEMSLNSIIASYLFIPVRNAYGDLYPVLILGWTLNFEMLFYVIFAIGLRWSHGKGMTFIFLAVGSMGLVGAFIQPRSAPLAFWCSPIVFEFLFGILLAKVHATGWRCAPLFGIAALLVGIVLLRYGSTLSGASVLWAPRAFWMGLPALLICASAALTREPASLGAVGRSFAAAGDASYILYLSHPFSLAVLSILSKKAALHDPWLFMGLALVVCIAVSMLLHQMIEKPSIKALNAWIRRSRMTAAVQLCPLTPKSK